MNKVVVTNENIGMVMEYVDAFLDKAKKETGKLRHTSYIGTSSNTLTYDYEYLLDNFKCSIVPVLGDQKIIYVNIPNETGYPYSIWEGNSISITNNKLTVIHSDLNVTVSYEIV